MMNSAHDLTAFILVCTVLIMMMAGFIVTILYLYRKRQLAHFKTIEELKLDYEKNLLHTQLEIQEQTLQHISREIHDNISLSLTLAKLNLNTLDWKEQGRVTAQIESCLEQITKAIEDLSTISRGLNTELILNQGLLGVLEKEGVRLRQLNLFQLDYSITGSPVFMDSQKELVIFRIIQEAFNNIIKHSRATRVYLNLDYTPVEIRVSIADNGTGFSMNGPAEGKQNGLTAGLANMRKRAELFSGSTSIQSAPNSGTKILITIPY